MRTPSVLWPLTELHEQGQQDPQRDHEGLPDVLVVEGEDGESLLVSGGVSLVVGVLRRVSGWTPRRLVAPRHNNKTPGGYGEEEEQPEAEEEARPPAPGGSQLSHVVEML